MDAAHCRAIVRNCSGLTSLSLATCIALLIIFVLLFGATNSVRSDDTAKQREFFESHVRPLLVARCLECHSHQHEVNGGLSLDSREDMLSGGDSGASLDVENWQASLLWKAVSYRDTNLQMPPDGKLSEREQEVLRQWLESGAFDPRQPVDAKRIVATGLTIKDAQSHWAYQSLDQSSVFLRFVLTIMSKLGSTLFSPNSNEQLELLRQTLPYPLH
jgi:hypothetical protein